MALEEVEEGNREPGEHRGLREVWRVDHKHTVQFGDDVVVSDTVLVVPGVRISR